MSSITFNHTTIVSAAEISELLQDDTTKVLLIRALDWTPAKRREEAADLGRHANGQRNANLHKLARILPNLSAMDIAAIKTQLAAQEKTSEPVSTTTE
jgi:hypothetical protein